MQSVRIYEIPDCKMVSSGAGMFGDENFDRFEAWMSSQPRGIFPRDFLFMDAAGFHWLYLYEEGMTVDEGLAVVDFTGGLYAIATDIDQQTDTDALNAEVDAFLAAHGFERDPSRPELGNVITPPAAKEIMGFEQMDYYIPIRTKSVRFY